MHVYRFHSGTRCGCGSGHGGEDTHENDTTTGTDSGTPRPLHRRHRDTWPYRRVVVTVFRKRSCFWQVSFHPRPRRGHHDQLAEPCADDRLLLTGQSKALAATGIQRGPASNTAHTHYTLTSMSTNARWSGRHQQSDGHTFHALHDDDVVHLRRCDQEAPRHSRQEHRYVWRLGQPRRRCRRRRRT